MKKELQQKISNSVVWLEALLALFILASIFIGVIDLVKYLGIMFDLPPKATYQEFKAFLGHLLLLVIGLEMIIVLVKHNPGSVIEVLVFAIARKLLIYADKMTDLLIGIVTLAILFAIRKYLFVRNFDETTEVIVGDTPIKAVNQIARVDISEDLGETIDEVVTKVITDKCGKLKENEIIKIGNAKIKVLKVENGHVNKVGIERLTEDNWRE